MRDTIRCRVMSIEPDGMEEFLSSRGMTFATGLESQIFNIELKQKPEILDRVAIALAKNPDEMVWDIMHANEHGISFYIYSTVSDHYLFIPKENVLAIHTVDKDFLNACREKSPRGVEHFGTAPA